MASQIPWAMVAVGRWQWKGKELRFQKARFIFCQISSFLTVLIETGDI